MILKKIDEKTYEDFVENSNQTSMYQSTHWYKLKKEERKKIELLGLFDEDNLVGVSLVIYLRVLKNIILPMQLEDLYMIIKIFLTLKRL